jgi:hypothetical protein
VLIFWMFYCLPPLLGVQVPGLLSGALALALVSAAYLAEIFRGGIQSVSKGQWEAASSLALPRRVVWTKVIVPQAIRISVPPFINFLTELLKGRRCSPPSASPTSPQGLRAGRADLPLPRVPFGDRADLLRGHLPVAPLVRGRGAPAGTRRAVGRRAPGAGRRRQRTFVMTYTAATA